MALKGKGLLVVKIRPCYIYLCGEACGIKRMCAILYMCKHSTCMMFVNFWECSRVECKSKLTLSFRVLPMSLFMYSCVLVMCAFFENMNVDCWSLLLNCVF